MNLQTKADFTALMHKFLDPLKPCYSAGCARLHLGETGVTYNQNAIELEAFSRPLWALVPFWVGGGSDPEFEKIYRKGLAAGTDPENPEYWGTTGEYDQCYVEMAAIACGILTAPEKLWTPLSDTEKQNLAAWLGQINAHTIPDCNWQFFRILVNLALKSVGMPYSPELLEDGLCKIDSYYSGDGWSTDGASVQKDYYIPWAIQYYGLLYSKFAADTDPRRAALYRQRAQLFAQQFVYWFDANGAALPFGRSLTYRFAMVAFWSAVAFAELDVLSPGIIKGVILRHLRWWQKQPIFDRDGILTLGFAYPNLAMCEDYNSPGSPYWALKVFLILALPEDHPFWQAEELALPQLVEKRVIPHAAQILQHSEHSEHVMMLTSGQLELNNYVNTEAKYTKFAYSSRFGFTIERGRYGIKHAACDSMLLLADGDGYYRGRRQCDEVRVDENFIWSRWSPWHDVMIETWLVPFGEWHLRLHRINSARTLQTVEGGFAVMKAEPRLCERGCLLAACNGTSVIVDLSPSIVRQPDSVVTPPNSSIMFPECASIPVLTSEIPQGESWLCCAVSASGQQRQYSAVPQLSINNNQVVIQQPENARQLSFFL